MAVELLESFATDFLEYQYFLCLGIIIEHGSLDYCAFYVRGSDLHFALIVEEKHLVELDRLIVLGRKTVDENLCTSLYLELLACNVNDCVHSVKLSKFRLQAPALHTAELYGAWQS